MSTDITLLRDIPPGKPLRSFIALQDKPTMLRTSCVYQPAELPSFSLLFSPGTLPPTEKIDTDRNCILNIDMGGPTVSIEARIKAIPNDQTLEMTAFKTITSEQMRDFFRVDAITEVMVKPLNFNYFSDNKKDRTVRGQTIDISGSGILAIFQTPPEGKEPVTLEMTLPNSGQDKISAIAAPVRFQELDDGTSEIAYEFLEISDENQDSIIGCCLEIQRKLLQLKVRVKQQN